MITISGVVSDETTLSNGIYVFEIKCKRKSGYYDEIPVMISENIIPKKWGLDLSAKSVKITGEIHSRMENKHSAFYVNAESIEYCDKHGENNVNLSGFICRTPNYRTTPTGREIADFMLAVENETETNYIPCIAWKENAVLVSGLKNGDEIFINGRAQSRKYRKKTENIIEERTAYEISVFDMEVLNEN